METVLQLLWETINWPYWHLKQTFQRLNMFLEVTKNVDVTIMCCCSSLRYMRLSPASATFYIQKTCIWDHKLYTSVKYVTYTKNTTLSKTPRSPFSFPVCGTQQPRRFQNHRFTGQGRWCILIGQNCTKKNKNERECNRTEYKTIKRAIKEYKLHDGLYNIMRSTVPKNVNEDSCLDPELRRSFCPDLHTSGVVSYRTCFSYDLWWKWDETVYLNYMDPLCSR